MPNPTLSSVNLSLSRQVHHTLISGSLALLFVYALPNSELRIFAQAAAKLTSLLTAAPVFEVSEGWLLPIKGQDILVNAACSGSHFFLMLTLLLAWQLPSLIKRDSLCIVASLMGGLLLTCLLNALRIICLSQVHYWIIPRLPENYAAFIHMLIGVAIFLPALMGLNLLIELYAKRSAPASSSSEA